MNAQCRWPNGNCWLPEDHFPVELARLHGAAGEWLPVERYRHPAHRVDLAANPAVGQGADWSVWSGCWPTCWRGR